MNRIRDLVVLAMLSLLLGSCKTTPTIEGKVKDYWGKPLAGVSVKLGNSTFQSTTDPDGRYSVEYVPGNIIVEFSKPNFQQEALSLNITAASVFPASDVTMLPLPVPPGIAVLGKTGPQSIAAVSIAHRTFAQRGRDPMGLMTETHDVATVGDTSTLLDSGSNLQVIENVSPNMRLVRLTPDGNIIDMWRSPMTMGNEGRFNLLNDHIRQMNQARLRTAALAPGRYAYVEIAPQSMFEGMHIASQNAYPFTLH